jgi:nucleoside-diphosphate-sugar epimerase
MPSPVLVTGGTGRLGRLVVRRLRDAGCDVRVLTRHRREATDGIRYRTGDLRTGEGVAAAVDGTAAIVHCATSSKGDVDATRNLVLTVTLHQQDGSLDTP